MRIILFFLAAAFLHGCASKGQETTSGPDTLAVVDSVTADFSHDQQLADRFLDDFERNKRQLDSVSFTASFEMGVEQVTYYYQGRDLLYVHTKSAGEGGYFERSLIEIGETGAETAFKINSEGEGFFTYIENERRWLKAGIDTQTGMRPVVNGPDEEKPLDYVSDLRKHLGAIAANRPAFKLTNGVYEFYAKDREVKGEYGPAHETEVYRVSQNLLDLPVPPPQINPDLIAGYLRKWTPLYEGAKGYERRTICGAERSIEFYERDGKYFWRDQGELDAMEFPIIEFAESEGDAISMTFNAPTGTNNFTVVFNEQDDVLFFDGRPFTASPDNYNVVDDRDGCGEEN